MPNQAGTLTGPTQPTTSNHSLQPSLGEPFPAVIQANIDLGWTAQRSHQDLLAEHGFTASYPSVRRFVRRLSPTPELPFRRWECGPKEEAPVDFGPGAPIQQAEGRRRRPHVFPIVLR